GQAKVSPGWQNMVVHANSGPAQLFSPANLELEIISPVKLVEGGQQRGVLVDLVLIRKVRGVGAFSRSPAHEGGLLLGVFLLYLLIARVSGRPSSIYVKRMALAAMVAVILVMAWALIEYRLEIALALPHLLWALAGGYVL